MLTEFYSTIWIILESRFRQKTTMLSKCVIVPTQEKRNYYILQSPQITIEKTIREPTYLFLFQHFC